MDKLISELITYGVEKGLVHDDDKIYVANRLIELFGIKKFSWTETSPRQLSEILEQRLI